MSYIGSNPITQYFQEGTDTFAATTARTNFTLSRPCPTINSIEVLVGSTLLTPTPASYTVSGTALTLGAPVSNTTVYVRYLTTSTYSITPSNGSIGISAISALGTPTKNTFLRGDGTWALQGIPQNVQSAAYTLQASDNGFHIAISTGGVTVPANVFSTGEVVSVYNNSTVNQTITSDVGITMYLAGTATTGNRTLAQYGMATILCVGANTFLISGQGVS
jgi:hypothetical protein